MASSKQAQDTPWRVRRICAKICQGKLLLAQRLSKAEHSPSLREARHGLRDASVPFESSDATCVSRDFLFESSLPLVLLDCRWVARKGHPKSSWREKVTESTTPAPADPNSGAGLIEFLDAAIEKGWLNVGSAKALRTATLKIFEVESGWASIDLRSLDSDNLLERFCNLKRNVYNDDSMRIYKTRFGQALKMHLARLDGDSNWKSYGPATRTSNPSKGAANGGKAAQKSQSGGRTNVLAAKADMSEPEGGSRADGASSGASLMRFPFPLRDTIDAWLALPRDLTKDEADRLSTFIGSLARQNSTNPTPALESTSS